MATYVQWPPYATAQFCAVLTLTCAFLSISGSLMSVPWLFPANDVFWNASTAPCDSDVSWFQFFMLTGEREGWALAGGEGATAELEWPHGSSCRLVPEPLAGPQGGGSITFRCKSLTAGWDGSPPYLTAWLEAKHRTPLHLGFVLWKVGLKVPGVGNSLAVQWLGPWASTAGGMGSIPGRGTKIPHAARRSQKKVFAVVGSAWGDAC